MSSKDRAKLVSTLEECWDCFVFWMQSSKLQFCSLACVSVAAVLSVSYLVSVF